VGRRRSSGGRMGSCSYRPLIGKSPVPQSMPQSVSCVPLYHPGRRDFPGPVGSENIFSFDLPIAPSNSSDGAHTLPEHWFVKQLVRRVSFRLFRIQCSGRLFFVGPSSPRAPLLRRHYPPSSLLRAHARIPMPPTSTSSFCLIGSVHAACTIHGWSSGPSRFGSALLCWSAAPFMPAARRVHLTSSSPTTSAFASLRMARLSAIDPTNGFPWVYLFDTAGIP
jgi:hypothetical protein